MRLFREVKPLPTCRSCGTPTANFASRKCEACKKKDSAE